LWGNPIAFYGQSGRLLLDPVSTGATDASTGNSVLRGER
jgi:uncharacterized protein